MIQIELSRGEPWPEGTDWDAVATRAAHAAIERTPHGPLIDVAAAIEISFRLTEDDEVRALNAQYRHKDKPTNVLSFPMVQPDLLDTVTTDTDDGEVLLGDIVLAYGVCDREAQERGVPLVDHATHLMVHGVLHLLGYDHIEDGAAEAMERIETEALASLGLHDPYPVRED